MARRATAVSAVRCVAAWCVAVSGSGHCAAGIVGNWDFSAGSLAPVAGVAGTQLTYLPGTPIYAAVGGTPNPPPLAFATTGSFGIAALGGNATVLRIPDMRGRGPAVGLMASFPLVANGTTAAGAPATKLNRYSLVMDVLIPDASLTGLPNYLDLFQPRGNADGALFVNKVTRTYGAATAYGGAVAANAWYRLAVVMQLDASTSAPRYETYIDGQPVGRIVWDQIVVDNPRNQSLKDQDLVPDGAWSIGALSETSGLLPSAASGFFAFNDNNNEVGELYVANLQFRDDALSAADVAALGGAAPGPIAVPEPTSLALVAAGVAAGCRVVRRPGKVAGRRP